LLQKGKLPLQRLIFCPAVLTVVNLAMTGRTDGSDPANMVRAAIGEAPGVMGLEIGLTV
jgi:hypothetical protein